MKKLLILGIALVMGCLSINAVPAMPGVKRTVTLSDGSKVELTLRGDEHYKFYTGSDGFAYRLKNNNFERYSIDEAQREWKSNIALANKSRGSKRTRGVGETRALSGKRKGLVILMQYNDLAFVTENAQAVFNDFFTLHLCWF